MINSINSINSSMSSMTTMRSGQAQGPPPYREKGIFQIGDSDGDGLLSSSELDALTKDIEKVTGNTINLEDAISSYDADQDGGLSGEELLAILSNQGYTPPEMIAPQRPSSDEVLTAYEKNSDMESEVTSVDVTT